MAGGTSSGLLFEQGERNVSRSCEEQHESAVVTEMLIHQKRNKVGVVYILCVLALLIQNQSAETLICPAVIKRAEVLLSSDGSYFKAYITSRLSTS